MHQVNVQFLCKLCTDSFTKVNGYLRHKKQKHFTQFRNTKCIFFEEKHVDQQSCTAELSPNSESKSTTETNSVAHSQNSKKQSKSSITSQRKKQCSKQLRTELKKKLKPDSKSKSKATPVVQLRRLKSKELESQSHSPNENKRRANQSKSKKLKHAAFSKPQPVEEKESLEGHQKFQQSSNCANNLVNCPPLPQPPTQPQPQNHSSNNSSIMDLNTFLLKSQQNLKNLDGITVTTSLSNLLLKRMKKHTCSAENCRKSYTTPGNLRQHIKRSHSSAMGQPMPTPTIAVPATVKQKKQKSKQNLVQDEEHSKVDKSLPKFQCDHCSKNYFFKSLLEAHALLHTNDKPFKCSFVGCASAFKRKYDLGIHERGRHRVIME